MSIWVHHQHWITPARRAWWSLELVRDLAEESPNAYHKFLWAHHLGYAAPYEVESRFGTENMRASRLAFFDERQAAIDIQAIARESESDIGVVSRHLSSR